MPETSTAPPATRVAVAVVEDHGRFLIGQRPPGIPLAGLWEFPGGKIRPGETPEEAAERECLEETGVAVRACGAYPTVVEQYAHGRVEVSFIACRMERDPAPPVCPPFLWVAAADLRRYEFPSANTALLRRLTGAGANADGC
ncbi:MAG: (deoxy)nucleoside triphosphate pyrophosphohydrolase [Planctomycetia bacterium]|nr:(deoxy)nucleoside triphosphate pyrophosphohydrolase [Planctomycetia bacterium]